MHNCLQDGRYFLQAAKELSDDWTLMKVDGTVKLSLRAFISYPSWASANQTKRLLDGCHKLITTAK